MHHTEMQVIHSWTARRAGGRITIKGTSVVEGQEIKVVGVDSIHAPGDGKRIVATDHKGVQYELAV